MVPIGPFHQDSNRAYLYCMIGDEPLMFKRQNELNRYQRRHVSSMRFDILPWSMSFLPISRPDDEIFLDSLFLDSKDFLQWHQDIYTKWELDLTRNIHFAHPDKIYRRALDACKEPRLTTTTCLSYAVNDCCDVSKELAASQRANSKIELVHRAKEAGFRIPHSVILKKADLQLSRLSEHFNFPNTELLLKTDGLGGGSNVRTFSAVDDCREFTGDFEPEALFVIQEKLDRKVYTEFITDFTVYPDRIDTLATRMKLTSGNRWFGNIYSPRFVPDCKQMENLWKCITNVQSLGYHSTAGFVCGIDYFQSKNDHVITEVNARWTGGLPVQILLARLGLANQLVYSHLDQLSAIHLEKYRRFVEKHLYMPNTSMPQEGRFKILPIAFSPQFTDGSTYIWIAVAGDYGAFHQAKEQGIASDALPLSTEVHKLLKEKQLIIGNAS
jgi:hypothetical protein